MSCVDICGTKSADAVGKMTTTTTSRHRHNIGVAVVAGRSVDIVLVSRVSRFAAAFVQRERVRALRVVGSPVSYRRRSKLAMPWSGR